MASLDRQKSEAFSRALDPFHTIVGRIASQYGALEHAIDQAIWKLAGIEPALGACITTQLGSTAARLRSLVALLNLRDGSERLIKKVNKLEQKNYEITELRNRAVHDALSVTDSL